MLGTAGGAEEAEQRLRGGRQAQAAQEAGGRGGGGRGRRTPLRFQAAALPPRLFRRWPRHRRPFVPQDLAAGGHEEDPVAAASEHVLRASGKGDGALLPLGHGGAAGCTLRAAVASRRRDCVGLGSLARGVGSAGAVPLLLSQEVGEGVDVQLSVVLVHVLAADGLVALFCRNAGAHVLRCQHLRAVLLLQRDHRVCRRVLQHRQGVLLPPLELLPVQLAAREVLLPADHAVLVAPSGRDAWLQGVVVVRNRVGLLRLEDLLRQLAVAYQPDHEVEDVNAGVLHEQDVLEHDV
mmetsp:Transcript_130033/g.404485  ORF Transcript_130033/g.404485 Transcript_130033/m.404485 type:complete len:293 (-) Transcript_130033:497-1375(-)